MDSYSTSITPLLLSSTTSHILSFYTSPSGFSPLPTSATMPSFINSLYSPRSAKLTAFKSASNPKSSSVTTSSTSTTLSEKQASPPTSGSTSPTGPRFLPPRKLSGRLRALSQEREGGPLRVYTPVVIIAEVADRKPSSDKSRRMAEVRQEEPRTLDSIPTVSSTGKYEKDITPARVCPRRGDAGLLGGLDLDMEKGDWTPELEAGRKWRRMEVKGVRRRRGVWTLEWERVAFWVVVVLMWVLMVVGGWRVIMG